MSLTYGLLRDRRVWASQVEGLASCGSRNRNNPNNRNDNQGFRLVRSIAHGMTGQ